MSISCLQCLFHVCDDFHDFDFASFCSASPHFSEIFFFRPSLLLVAVCAHFGAGDRGRSLSKVPKGGLSLGTLLPTHSRPTQRLYRPRLGLLPRLSTRL